jgi:hypothetical protein
MSVKLPDNFQTSIHGRTGFILFFNAKALNMPISLNPIHQSICALLFLYFISVFLLFRNAALLSFDLKKSKNTVEGASTRLF